MTRLYNGELRRSGLGIAQLSILSALRRCGPTNVGKLSVILAVERTTLLRNTELLRRRGWVQTTKKKGQRSSVALTVGGHKALTRAIPIWSRVQSRIRELLGPKCVRAITRILPMALQER
jgi:DNA-binding MarR family transcriptional regulator